MRVVSVRFRTPGRSYDFDAGDIELSLGQAVVVDTERGLGVGYVSRAVRERSLDDGALKRVIRVALERDLQRRDNMDSRETEALEHVVREVRQRELPMKVLGVEYFFDASKVIVYFNAEDRVDFRGLVKDLIAKFHTRVEMKQIGARDGARLIGGIGPCGLELCCARFLTKFDSVSVKTVKTQSLSLNPSNITGVCGKLKCCLNYETAVYEDAKQGMPKLGKRIATPFGEGKVTGHNIFRQTVFVKITGLGEREIPNGELQGPAAAPGAETAPDEQKTTELNGQAAREDRPADASDAQAAPAQAPTDGDGAPRKRKRKRRPRKRNKGGGPNKPGPQA